MRQKGRPGRGGGAARGWRFAKFLFFFSGILLLIRMSEAQAGVIGDPTASGKPNTLSQFNLDYDLTQRKLRAGEDGFGGQATSERILLQGIYGLTPFVDLYLRVGIADLETNSREFEGDFGPALGGGGRWTLFQKGDFKVGVGIQFLEFFSRDGGSPTPRVNWGELESFIGGALQGMERFTPYIGLSFSKVQAKFKNGPTARSDGFIGVFIGAEFLIYQNYYFASEARISSENSLTLQLNYHL
ncbi:MAG: hypothetical protein HY282_18080 [Nitrospirae bacterium]|nr:hypothetical protein [Candidatus Manganitrophaceae bacterium]